MKNLLLLCGMLLLCHTAHARPKNGGDKDSTRHAVKNPLAETQTLRSFPELDSYLQQNGSLNTLLNVPNAAIAEFTQDYITTNFSVSDLVADNRSQAAQTFAELDRLGSYVDMIKSQPKNMMPRWWMACDYEPMAKSADGLAWQLRGYARREGQ